MQNDKLVIDGLDGFRALVGTTVGPSEPVEVTRERIEHFCRAVNNDEWTHWDMERAEASRFGTLIAPAMFTAAYFPRLQFDMIEIRNIPTFLIQGAEGIRLFSPLKCGDTFTMSFTIAEVDDRANGIAVRYDARFSRPGEDKPFALASFIIRYLED